MSIDIEALIQELNEKDEHERIEAKTGSQAGKAVMKTVVSFSNEPRLDGGYILFGVSKTDGSEQDRYQVVGVPDPDKVSADFSSQCAGMLNRQIRPQVTTDTVDGKPVVVAYVPEAQPAQKPVFIKSEGLENGTYRRIGSTDQSCTDVDLEEIYQERSGESYDANVASSADLDDINPEAVEDYRKTRARVNSEAEELNWDDEDLLRALRCVEKQKGVLRPTVAGILLFGSKMALRRLFPAMRIDYTRVPGREWMDDPDRRYVNSIEIRAPLLQAIRRAQSAVVDDLPKGFSLPEESLQRTDEPLIPLKVLREAIVNAVMHRNYRVNSAIHIIRYANRIEIRNPGYSLVDPDDLSDPISETRNPTIASVLHDTRFAETKGTGIEVMRKNLHMAGLAPPDFDSDRSADHFITTFYLHHFLDAEDLDWLGRFKHLNLSEAEIRGLIHAREAGRIDNKTYRELNGVETLKASQDLGRLRDAGLLSMEGQSTATYYEPSEKLLDTGSPPQGELPFEGEEAEITQVEDQTSKPDEETAQAEDQTSKLDRETTQAEDEITQAEDQASKLDEETTQAEDEDAADSEEEIPEELLSMLEEWGGRGSTGELRQLIIHLCRWKALSAVEIADYVERDRYHLTRKYLRPLVAEGKLERTRPDAPRSPNQKYRAASNE
jgi:ATP-dependent DNA helicase RecG